MEQKIDSSSFYRKLEKIHKIWLQSEESSKFDCICFIRGRHTEELPQKITSTFQEYLIGYNFTDTLIILTKTKFIFFLGSNKKKMIEETIKPLLYNGPPLEIILRDPKTSIEEYSKIFSLITNNTSKQMLIGYIVNENAVGPLGEEWKAFTEKHKDHLNLQDCSSTIFEFLAHKDQSEIEYLRISSKYCSFVMHSLIKKFENNIDLDNNISHDELSNEIKSLAEKPVFVKKFLEKSKLNVDLGDLELVFPPSIQSGGNYDLEILCGSNKNHLSSDVILLKVGTRYKDYNSIIVRSFMIDSDKSQQINYKYLLEAFQFMISLMIEGQIMNEIYEKIVDFVKNKDANLVSKLPESFGYGIGYEIKNNYQIINENNKYKISQNMAFLLILSFKDLVSEKGMKYTLQLSDIVVVKLGNSHEIFTKDIPKSINDITYNMEDEDEKNEKDKNAKNQNNGSNTNAGYRTRRAAQQQEDEKNEINRKQHQLELLEKKNKEYEERFKKNQLIDEDVQITKKQLSSIKSYNNKTQFPVDLRLNKIYVDSKAYSLILPVNGMSIPFHISLVKNISSSDEGGFTFLRINFHSPNSGINNLSFNDINLESPVYIREFVYKSKDQKNMLYLQKTIKDLIKILKTKDQEDKDKNDLVSQENLIMIKGKKNFLNDVIIRPNITSKKTSGLIEAHQNGFRFTSNRGDKIDIIYKNIKHALFQPCENELIVLLHLHLHNPILIGKKKTNDVQFFREAGAQSDDLDIRRRGNDMEEYEIELKDRRNRDRINEEFRRFTQGVSEISRFDFDMPYKDLAFSGVPFKSLVTLLPNAFCLASVIELPFFVITLDDVELVHFERVQLSIKNFDMVFVFKDLNRPAHRITTIEMESLEIIKSWLDSVDILYSEGTINLKWPNILSKIKNDPEEFLKEGGWSFLHDGADDSSPEDEENEDSSFAESEFEENEESDYSEESEEYEDSEVSGGDEELSEEGLSWDKLEERAEKMDKEHFKNKENEIIIKKRGKN